MNKLNHIYHGTLNIFNVDKLKDPSWFSIAEDQCIKWVIYKCNKSNNCQSNGYIHKFEFIKKPVLIDLNYHTNLRLDINAYGNHKFAKKIKNGDFGKYDGYINLEDQAEIMLIDPLKFIKLTSSKEIYITNDKIKIY